MGIRGLTSFLKEKGLLASTFTSTSTSTSTSSTQTGEETKNTNTFCALNDTVIDKGSTFAIDGSGLAFHIFKLAYLEHYKTTMNHIHTQNNGYNQGQGHGQGHDHPQKFENNVHVLTNLLPPFIPLSIIRNVTEQIIHTLIHVHEINLHVFIDGKSNDDDDDDDDDIINRMKDATKKSRRQSRQSQEMNLKTFFVHKTLPMTCLDGKSKSRRKKKSKQQNQQKNNQQNRHQQQQQQQQQQKIPEAHKLLSEFPIPPLLFAQVYHTFRQWEAKSKYNSASASASASASVSASASTTDSLPAKVQITVCDGEADQSVAMASAHDVTRRTFAVGLDSDYCMFGYPTNANVDDNGNANDNVHQDVDVQCNGTNNVQYLSLDALNIHECEREGEHEHDRILRGYVITREDIAKEMDISEHLLLEASLLMGNDYTGHFVFGSNYGGSVNVNYNSNVNHNANRNANRKELKKLQKQRQQINFFRDHFDPYTKPTWSRIIDCLSELGNENEHYIVESKDEYQQAAFSFSRDWYHLKDVSCYMKRKSSSSSKCSSSSSEQDGNGIENDVLGGEYDSSFENLKAHIFARPLKRNLARRNGNNHDECDDHDNDDDNDEEEEELTIDADMQNVNVSVMVPAMMEALDHIQMRSWEENDNDNANHHERNMDMNMNMNMYSNHTLASNLEWESDIVPSIMLQRRIAEVWRERSMNAKISKILNHNTNGNEAVHAPCQIFHHGHFFRSLSNSAARRNKRNEDADAALDAAMNKNMDMNMDVDIDSIMDEKRTSPRDNIKPTSKATQQKGSKPRHKAKPNAQAKGQAKATKTSSQAHDNPRTQLPIDAHRNDILRSIANNRVTVIQGETGSGKSTRVPVMCLESAPPDPRLNEVKMFICQPRRIAAKSLTERLRSTEPHLKHILGLRMGHGVKEYETKHTRAWFVTAGYLVRYLANNADAFATHSHLIIDECHERSVDTDLLCLLAKRLLVTNPTIRIVLMSATVAADMYQEYFNVHEPPIFVGVRTHPIQEYFIEDMIGHGSRFRFSPKDRKNLATIADKCIKTKCQFTPNAHFMEMLHRVAVSIAVEVGTDTSSVLIFVPGIADIISIVELFEDMHQHHHGRSYKCIPIHSDIPFEDQLSVFDTCEDGEIKIVVATNAAESSLTLPDVDHVICFGLCKTIQYNKKSHRQVLELSWITQANATQRAGRTGRVRKGNVYRLYPRKAFSSFFDPFEEGEILRSPLDSVILNLRTIKEDEPVSELLTSCIEPPDIQNIQNAYVSLHKQNFITEPSDTFGITSLGTLVTLLGIDLALGSMIGLGIQFGLLAETVELAAIFSVPKTPWLLPNALLQEPDHYNDIVSKTYVSKAHFDKSLYSEPFSIMNLLYEFDRCHNRTAFCRKYSLSYPRLSRLAKMRDNLRQRVANAVRIDVSTLYPKHPPHEMDESKLTVLRAMHVWVFRDGIIELRPQVKDNASSNDSFSVELGGDEIERHHLNTILDERRHKFALKTETKENYVGKYKPIVIDGKAHILTDEQYEERLVSFSIERGFDMMVSRTGNKLAFYISAGKQETLLPLLQNAYKHVNDLLCEKNENTRRGWKARECGAWNVSLWGSNEIENITIDPSNALAFLKYAPSKFVKLPAAKKKFRSLYEHIKSSGIENVSILFIERDSLGESKFDLFCLGPKQQAFNASDFADIMATPNIQMALSNSTKRQKIVFLSSSSDEKSIDDDTSPMVPDLLPEGMRIMEALLSGRRKDRVIYFLDNNKKERTSSDTEESDTSYLEVRLMRKAGDSNHMKKWKWIETKGDVLLDSFSVPASVSPQNEDIIYASCGNILELNGGRLLAENLTILPLGNQFLTIAQMCIAGQTRGGRGKEEAMGAADTFHKFFWERLSDNSDLGFSEEAVTLLCEAFNVIDGFDLKPWCPEDIAIDNRKERERERSVSSHCSDDETDEVYLTNDTITDHNRNKNRRKDGNRNAKINSKTKMSETKGLAQVLCDELGNDLIPSSFAQLCTTNNASTSTSTRAEGRPVLASSSEGRKRRRNRSRRMKKGQT